MSKESYARGFCKVAEAHGIDPRQLAKYAAPKYDTEGWVPKGVSTNGIPYTSTSGQIIGTIGQEPNTFAGDLKSEISLSNIYPTAGQVAESRLGIDGGYLDKLRKWFSAHNKAVSEAVAPVKDILRSKDDAYVFDDLRIQKAIEKRYHDAMHSLTGNVDRASSPVEYKRK